MAIAIDQATVQQLVRDGAISLDAALPYYDQETIKQLIFHGAIAQDVALRYLDSHPER